MKISFKRRDVITCAILLIILAVYNIFYFVIPFNRDFSVKSFWITYISTSLIVLMAFISIVLGLNDKKLKSRIFGIPIVFLCAFTLLAQFIVDCIVMIVGCFICIEWWVSTIMETLLFAFFLLSLISQKSYKSKIAEIDSRKNKTLFIKKLRIQLETLLRDVRGTSIEYPVENLYECVRYTTPISNVETYEIEEEISEKVRQLKKYINDGNYVKAKKEIGIIVSLVKERKSILMK